LKEISDEQMEEDEKREDEIVKKFNRNFNRIKNKNVKDSETLIDATEHFQGIFSIE
jgi:hypothetical protein